MNSLDTQLSFGIYYVNFQALMAKILGKTHKPKVIGADTHSVSLISYESHLVANSHTTVPPDHHLVPPPPPTHTLVNVNNYIMLLPFAY